MESSKLNEIIQTTLQSIKGIVESDTIVGKPIDCGNGTVIIPVSKISLGFASGGLDYSSKKEASDKEKNFGGGGGTGVSVTPVSFLVVKQDGSVELLNMSLPDTGVNKIASVGNIIEKSPDVIERIKDIFTK